MMAVRTKDAICTTLTDAVAQAEADVNAAQGVDLN